MRFDLFFSLSWETMSEQLQTMSNADVQQLSSFLAHLLDDVICQQVLPDTVKSLARTCDVSFAFKPRINVDKDLNLNMCRADITVTATHPLFPDINVTNDGPGLIPQLLTGFKSLPSDLHRRCMLQTSLLHDIFSPSRGEAQRAWHVRIFYEIAPSGCPLADHIGTSVNTSFYFRLQAFNCLTDLLAALLSGGYDLTSVQPFLSI